MDSRRRFQMFFLHQAKQLFGYIKPKPADLSFVRRCINVHEILYLALAEERFEIDKLSANVQRT
jgi:hypothetical protein